MSGETIGTAVLGFGPQPMDWLGKAAKICGKGAVVDTDVARMAGAVLAAGEPAALALLRQRLEAGALAAEEKQHRATSDMHPAVVRWLAIGNRGLSSESIVQHLTGYNLLKGGKLAPPRDAEDFDRCLQLLADVPHFRLMLPQMAEVSPEWAALIENWAAIERLHLDEVGLGFTKADPGRKTNALIHQVLNAARGMRA